MVKVFCVGSNSDAKWLLGYELTDNFDEADIIIMPGGMDWNPQLYNERAIEETYYASNNDTIQLRYFFRALIARKFIIGICRGAQLLGITAGGRLFQDVNKHHNSHYMTTNTNRQLRTNSIHHQMVDWNSIPKADTRAALLAYADNISDHYITQYGDAVYSGELLSKSSYKEPEVFFIRSINAFGVQGHPEMGMPEVTNEWLRKMIRLLLTSHKRKMTNSPWYGMIDDISMKRLEHFAITYPVLLHLYEELVNVQETLKINYNKSFANYNVSIDFSNKDVTLFEDTDAITIVKKEESEQTQNNKNDKKNRIPDSKITRW